MMILQKRWAYQEKRCITGFRLEIFRNRRSRRCPNCSAALSTIFSAESQRKEVDKMEQNDSRERINKIIELLEKQLQLLSEQSRNAEGLLLVQLSEAMVSISRFLVGD